MKSILMLSAVALTLAACQPAPSDQKTVSAKGKDPACFDTEFEGKKLKCTEKPGLAMGQQFRLVQELEISVPSPEQSKWVYFADRRKVEKRDLSQGQGYCAVVNERNHLPTSIYKNGLVSIPAMNFSLSEISWYIETVFMRGVLPGGQEMEIVITCGTVGGQEQTSIKTIQEHLTGTLELIQ